MTSSSSGIGQLRLEDIQDTISKLEALRPEPMTLLHHPQAHQYQKMQKVCALNEWPAGSILTGPVIPMREDPFLPEHLVVLFSMRTGKIQAVFDLREGIPT